MALPPSLTDAGHTDATQKHMHIKKTTILTPKEIKGGRNNNKAVRSLRAQHKAPCLTFADHLDLSCELSLTTPA
jgi:hypothetical protein